MHQMTENDGYHKHLSDTKCRSAAELRDTSAALNTRGKLDTQHLEINNEGFNYNIFSLDQTDDGSNTERLLGFYL